MSKQETKKVQLTIGGRLLYPKHEGKADKYALEMNNISKTKLEEELIKVFPEFKLNIKEDKESGLPLLNMKSNFEVPIFDKEGNKIEEPLYHGAEVYASVTIKEYKYMGKSGITAYVGGIVLLQNGENTGASYDSIMKKVI